MARDAGTTRAVILIAVDGAESAGTEKAVGSATCHDSLSLIDVGGHEFEVAVHHETEQIEELTRNHAPIRHDAQRRHALGGQAQPLVQWQEVEKACSVCFLNRGPVLATVRVKNRVHLQSIIPTKCDRNNAQIDLDVADAKSTPFVV